MTVPATSNGGNGNGNGNGLSVADQIRQLTDARKLVLSDVSYYPQVVQGILPLVARGSPLPLRRWGSDFLAEAFATPALASSQKETLSLLVLETLKGVLEREGDAEERAKRRMTKGGAVDGNGTEEDPQVLKSVILAAASIYPLALRWVINNSYDTTTWERLTAVKSRILRLWNTAPPSIRICCIKFAQRVVLAQTVAGEQDLRRGDVLRVHAGMVPPNHPLLEPQTLEAEATGLLDRMLGVLQENSVDALLVDATLNCLSILLRSRPTTYNRILNAVLNFNPLKLANSPATPKNRVFIRSMEKTTRSLLGHLAKRDPHNPNTVRIHQHLERLNRSRIEIFDEAGRKRPYAEQGDALDTAKRQKMLPGPAAAVPELHITPLKPGPHSLADVFTFVTNSTIKSFDVTVVPADMVAKISVVSLVQVDPSLLARAVQGVRDRLASFKEVQPSMLNPDTAPLGVEEDDEDEYDPDDYAAEDTEQILNKLDGASPDDRVQKMEAAALALGSFALPSPSPITPELTLKAGQGTLQRVFDMTKTLDEPAPKKSKAGLNRLASSSFDRDSWITLITRLATRASSGLEDIEVKDEADNKSLTKSLASVTRESLYTYVLEDFRKRIDIAVSWLSEEWYNDQLEKQRGSHAPLHYNTWALKVIDGLLPYLTPQDKVLTRFLSELPELNAVMLARVKSLCRDPSMVQLALTSLLYLVMMRPPIREVALDTVQDIWTEFEDARSIAAKYLVKYRPEFLEAAKRLEDSKREVAPSSGSAAIMA